MGRGRAPCCEKIGLNRGSWTPAEDMRLVAYIQNFGHGNWRALPKQAGLLRCGKSCRLRWINYLRPDIKRGNFSKDEEDTIIKLHSLLGNKWSKIASCLPGRTDNEIKNVWNTHLKKRVVSTKQQKLPSPSSSVDEQSDVEIKTSNNNAKIPESTQTLDSSENSQYSGESQDASEGKIEIVIEPSLDMSFMLDDSELFNLSSSSSNDSDSTNTNNQDQDQDPLWNIMDEEYPNFMLGDCCEEQTNNRTTTLGEESSCSKDESKRLLANLEKELDLDFWGDEDNLQQSLSDPVSCYFQRAL